MVDVINPPRSWREPETHFLVAMQSEWYSALVRLQSVLTAASVRFWTERGIGFGHLPVTTGSVSSPMGLGSDSQPVQVDLQGIPTYLADSMQFGLEYLCRLSPKGAGYLMPSFRGEAVDPTHLCQFFHSEAEIPGDLTEVMAVVEEYVKAVTAELYRTEIAVLTRLTGGELGHIERLLSGGSPFTRMTFDEAVEHLGARSEFVQSDELGRWRTLTRAGERQLMAEFGEFVWVTHWDHLAVPFYQAYDEGTGRARNADLLFGPGEVVGAGERHVTGSEVRAALKAHDVEPSVYEWYLAMKDSTPLLTSGFGMGVERFLMWLLRQDDIRDFQLLPRENGKNILP
ncbi:asparagine synthetase A [Streptomyces canus]|jgi:aspartyl/asparaginyl-tRNA synthetase|uniref:asparagine synthetase A n=1 Tax=Streptomyces sp. SAI-144 TaxID=2940544 RepID=UPI00247310BB|nr:asparagine synthetase A [Streptomyces sp. SAI-144]